ncbi:MAG: hypothetical protein HYR68_08005 [Burkholderiales bacterium]|nr:hypothetical protein [Burkholderiales bacterium]MBI3729181.1 hypothetical protein [Burkholderiales bacterium]
MKSFFQAAVQILFSFLFLFAGNSFAQGLALPAPDCTSKLPVAKSHTIAYVNYQNQSGQITFWESDNFCYADKAVWWEPGSAAYLTQRASVYSPVNPAKDPVGTKRPVIIYTHPNGQTEKFMFKESSIPSDNPYPTSTLFQSVLVQALNAGYTVITLEFRHPIASYDAKLNTAPGNTDIRDGIQFMRYNAEQLHIDPDNLFLVGQSRGSLNMLWGIKDNAASSDAQRPWRSASSKANAIWDYQAQTCYDRATVENNFVLPSSYAVFEADPKFPEPPGYKAGCSLGAVGNSSSIPPMVLMYDEAPLSISTVSLQNYCSTDWSSEYCWKKLKWHDADNIWNTWFDEHDANFGVAMNQAYGNAGAGTKIQACYGVAITYDDPSGPWNGYRGLTSFFNQYRTVPAVNAFTPFECPQVKHTPPNI